MNHGRMDSGHGGHDRAGLPRALGVLGATSFVGRRLLPLAAAAGWTVRAYSRRPFAGAASVRSAAVDWAVLDQPHRETPGPIPCWVSLCPLWVLPERLAWLERRGVKRLVAVSSTSRFTKAGSSDPQERETAAALAAAERAVLDWAVDRGVRATILRPTLVYDGRNDRNVAAVAAFIRRRGWFPVLRPATGLRQPVHVDDVAAACLSALPAEPTLDAYDLSGGETLPYREMVSRVFRSLGKPPRLVAVPVWAVRAAIPLARMLPGFAGISPAVFLRMNEDLVFDHADAARDLGFRPRSFTLTSDDDSPSAGPLPDRGSIPSLPRVPS